MKKQKLEIKSDGFLLDGKPFYLASGDIHYFRIHPSGWQRRLELMKDFGLNTVETYVAWNCHEPKEGQFCFDGMYDLSKFLYMCEKMGLYVLLRPTPYICAEFDLGGVPSWLLKDRSITLRCNDERWLAPIRRYYKVLFDIVRPYLSTNGGPIIMVAVENEYGFRGNDRKYLQTMREMLVENGVDVPMFTTDPYEIHGLVNGSFPDLLEGVNFRALPEIPTEAFKRIDKYHAGFPHFVGEFWGGKQIHWLEPNPERDPVLVAKSYKESLELGAHVNFYMFCGGTNFGFTNGALLKREEGAPDDAPRVYVPQATSYDVNSLVSENGEPQESYFLCRDVLDEFMGREKRPHVAPAYETQKIDVKLTEYATLWDNIDELAQSRTMETAPRYMEDLDQDFGYILYRTQFDRIDGMPEVTFRAEGVKDYARVYKNGKYVDYWFRDRKAPETLIEVDAPVMCMDVLAENMGRVNSGYNLANNRKGVEGFLAADWSELHEIETVTLPMNNLSKLKYKAASDDVLGDTPTFLRGTFDAKAGVDTFFGMDGFDHGFVMVNGFNVGRFLPYGPQRTLYIPGGLLKEKDNVIEIFDMSPKALTAHLVEKAELRMKLEDETETVKNGKSLAVAYDNM